MIRRYEHAGRVWVDLSKPSADEAREVMEDQKIPAELLSDITTPVPRSSAVAADGCIKLTIDYPVVKRTDIEQPHEIKFFITKAALVTARYEDITALHKFAKEFEVLTILDRPGKGVHGGHLFYAVMSTLYEALGAKLDYLDTQLGRIQHEMFNEREKEMVFEISKISRKLITFRQVMTSHGDVMHDARPHFLSLFGNSFEKELRELAEYYDHIIRRLGALYDTLDEVRNTNLAIVNTKQNEVMKTLTVMAFIILPLSLFSSIFSMNVSYLPISGKPYDFFILMGIMLGLGVAFFTYFKYKKWF